MTTDEWPPRDRWDEACAVCIERPVARSMCGKHYQRWNKRNRHLLKNNGRGIAPIDRLLSRCVENAAGCWVYTWPTDRKGYARLRISDRRKQYGHRIAWNYFIGEWPDGLIYDHLCRNPACVNPYHGEPVPARVNNRRAPAWTGNRTSCPAGHPYEEGNVLRIRKGALWERRCRKCRNETNRAYRQRLKEKDGIKT